MIYICDDINLDYPYEELEPHVSLERKVKALKYVERIDYALSLLAYSLLKIGIFRETGIVLADYTTFEYTGHNKPRIEGVNKRFNMSHCARCVGAALDDYDIGIDVESDKNITDNLINYTMNKSEVIKIKTDKSYFYRYWTNKESYLKLTGSGIDIRLTALDFSSFENKVFDYKDLHFYSIKEKNYALSICSKEKQFKDEDIIKLSFKDIIKELEEME